MLAVQRELQQSQLRFDQELSDFKDRQEVLSFQIEQGLRRTEEQGRQIDRLIGYSLSNETDHLNFEERLRALKQRRRRLDENGEG